MAQKVLTGIPVSSGVAIGRAFFMNRRVFSNIPRQTVIPGVVPLEIERLEHAFEEAGNELTASREKVPPELRKHALLIDSHLTMLKDPKLLSSAVHYIDAMHINAEWAILKTFQDIQKSFQAIEDAYIRERIQDVRLVAELVISKLTGTGDEIKAIESRVILMANDLAPADTVGLDVKKIMGFTTVQGGKTSHTGILARSLGIPAIVGAQEIEDNVKDGQFVIIDALAGKILIEPDEEELERYADLKYQYESYRRSIIRNCRLPAETVDGDRIKILANIELVEEASQLSELGAEGVGLYRTEYSYMNRLTFPEEEELYDEYAKLMGTLNGRRMVFRSLDIGSEKLISRYDALQEDNPALGLRSIRFCLEHKDIFKTQLRAVLRSAVEGDCALMFPMISGLTELRQAKAVLEEVKDELKRDGLAFRPDIPVGIMIELPAAVLIADQLAEAVDFFSIGTNDLIQYSLGIDRTNKHVSHLYQPLHPSVVRSIKYTVDSAHKAGIEVSLCGEVASDPYCVPILMGMKVDCLSMNPQSIPGIKRIIRQLKMDECQELLRLVLECPSVTEINRLVKDTIFQRFPEELTFYSSLLEEDEAA